MQALNDLSLTINPSTDDANNGGENTATQEPKVVNLKCELVNVGDRQKSNNNNASVNGEGGAEDAAAGGDGSAARIESVDTTTVQCEMRAVLKRLYFWFECLEARVYQLECEGIAL